MGMLEAAIVTFGVGVGAEETAGEELIFRECGSVLSSWLDVTESQL
jgi:hypothetical protein